MSARLNREEFKSQIPHWITLKSTSFIVLEKSVLEIRYSINATDRTELSQETTDILVYLPIQEVPSKTQAVINAIDFLRSKYGHEVSIHDETGAFGYE